MSKGDTNITTLDRDLKVICGNNGQQELEPPSEMALASVRYIYTDFNDIKNGYIRLGFHLDEFQRCEYYKEFGYSSLADFVKVNLGLDSTALSRCLSVFYAFAMRDKESGKYKIFIDERFKDFGYSQLCEMVPLTEEERKLITPDMTVKDIREFKKNLKSKKNCDVAKDLQPPKYDSCADSNFIFDLLEKCGDFVKQSALIDNPIGYSAKQISFYDDENDYVIQYRVTKKKKG